MRVRLTLAAALVLGGCAASPAPAPPPLRIGIEGRLDGPAAGSLGAQLAWVVELRDDTADRVLAEQRGAVGPTQPPIGFELSVDVARADPVHRHSVRGAISVAGLVQWLTEPQAVELRRGRTDLGSLRLLRYNHPGGFASVLDCGGRRLVAGYIGERLRLSEGDRMLELQPVRGSRPPRFERAGEPLTFVQWHDDGATVSLAGQLLPRCVALPLH